MQALHLSVFAIVSHCILSVCSHGSIGALLDKVDRIDDDLLNLQLDFSWLKEQFRNEVDVLKLSLRADLLNNMVPEYMEKQVKDYIVQTLRSQSLGELLNSQIGTELGQLKQELHQLRSKYHRVTKAFRNFEEQRTVMRDGLMKRNKELEKRVEILEQISEGTSIRLQDMESETSRSKSSVKVMNDTISGRVRILEREFSEAELRIQDVKLENSLLKNSLEMKNESLNDEVESEYGCASKDNMNDTISGRVRILERKISEAGLRILDVESENSHLKNSLETMNESLNNEVESECGCASKDNMNDTISGRVRILEREFNEAGLRIQDVKSENSLLKNSLDMMNESLNNELESECGCAYHENKTVSVRVGTLERGSDDVWKQIGTLKYETIRINSTLDRIQTILTEVEEIKHDLSVENQNEAEMSFPFKSVNTPLQLIQEQKTRLLLVSRFSSDKQFKQLNIHSNTLQNYNGLPIYDIAAVVYDPKSRTLIVARYTPDEIYSSPLDTSSLTLLREGIASRGMAVDEMRQIVFVTTLRPRSTISRMTTDGKFFRPIVDLPRFGNYPRAITVDPRHRRVYATLAAKLVSVDYNGLNLRKLATGRSMSSIVLDYTNNILYYNDRKKVIRRSLDENTSTQVTELGDYPEMYQFYNDTLYISHGKQIDAVYFVHKSNIIFRLKVLDKSHLLCLIPDSQN